MLWVAGGLTIFALFFLGTLFVIDLFNSSHANNRLRAEHIALLSGAIGPEGSTRTFQVILLMT
jgi:hypothetical protein